MSLSETVACNIKDKIILTKLFSDYERFLCLQSSVNILEGSSLIGTFLKLQFSFNF